MKCYNVIVVVKYHLPENWAYYDMRAIVGELVEAKATVLSLTTTPYQRPWVDALQQIQLKMEVAGTSRIEGADFTESELEAALNPSAKQGELFTRSQRQAHSAVETYRWIAKLPPDPPIDGDLVREVHRRIVTGCDDDHCAPGQLRDRDCNVIFGSPPHRGAEGGEECRIAFDGLVTALQKEFPRHDLLIQALALHYHFAAIHPFLDGNGRTARALEALMLQRAGLRDVAFIAMSNFYNDEKKKYLESLAAVRSTGHDLTLFLLFGLQGISLQCRRLFSEIRKHMAKALFRDMMYNLFNRLQTTRRRVIKDRQIEILKLLLDVDYMEWHELIERVQPHYGKVANFGKVLARDMASLRQLGTIEVKKVGERRWNISVRLEWPSEITESTFFEKISSMPKGKTYKFLP